MYRKGRKKVEAFDVVNTVLVLLVLLLIAYPLYYVIIASVSDPNAVNSGQVVFGPKEFTIEGYSRVLRETRIWRGYLNSIIYTVSYTLIGLLTTLPAAYALSRKDFRCRNFFMVIFMITTFFGGGLIPTYLLMKNLHIVNTIWAIVLPGSFSVFNAIVVRTYFQTTIPFELQEAAKIDGCSDFRIFVRIMLPLSKPIIAVIALFLAVAMWNSYFAAMMYLTKEDKYPLQLIMNEILVKQQLSSQLAGSSGGVAMAEQARASELIKYSVMIVSSLPILILYPFLQKYFIKGIMVGAVKG